MGEDTAPDDLAPPYQPVAVGGAAGDARGVQVVPPRAPPAPQRAAPPEPTVAIADAAEQSDPALRGPADSDLDPFDDWLSTGPVGEDDAPPPSSASGQPRRVITQRPKGGLRRPRGGATQWLIRGAYLSALLGIGYVGVQAGRKWLKQRDVEKQALQAMPPVRPTVSQRTPTQDVAAQALRPVAAEAPRVARGSVDPIPKGAWEQPSLAAREPASSAAKGSALPDDPAARVPRNQARRRVVETPTAQPRDEAERLVERASQKVVDGDLRGALGIYEELAERWPGEPSHAAMVKALRSKLER